MQKLIITFSSIILATSLFFNIYLYFNTYKVLKSGNNINITLENKINSNKYLEELNKMKHELYINYEEFEKQRSFFIFMITLYSLLITVISIIFGLDRYFNKQEELNIKEQMSEINEKIVISEAMAELNSGYLSINYSSSSKYRLFDDDGNMINNFDDMISYLHRKLPIILDKIKILDTMDIVAYLHSYKYSFLDNLKKIYPDLLRTKTIHDYSEKTKKTIDTIIKNRLSKEQYNAFIEYEKQTFEEFNNKR